MNKITLEAIESEEQIVSEYPKIYRHDSNGCYQVFNSSSSTFFINERKIVVGMHPEHSLENSINWERFYGELKINIRAER